MAKLLKPQDIDTAVTAIKSGDVVAIPTETVYGLAGNAFNPEAVGKIFSSKERPSFDPLIVHVKSSLKSLDSLDKYGVVNKRAMSQAEIELTDALIQRFWPGPLTIILPKSDKIPDLVTSGLTSVGVRMPSHPVTQKFLELCDLPIAAPSANKFGRISPTTANHVEHELGNALTFILDGGPCAIGLESTVIAIGTDPETSGAGVWLVRPGKITSNELEKSTGIAVKMAKNEHEKASPGMLLSHYAPRKTMLSLDDSKTIKALTSKNPVKALKVGLLVPSGDGSPELSSLMDYGIEPMRMILLSTAGDDKEAAHRLFASMRELDDSDAELIITGSVPTNAGLWLAISDRLNRACKH